MAVKSAKGNQILKKFIEGNVDPSEQNCWDAHVTYTFRTTESLSLQFNNLADTQSAPAKMLNYGHQEHGDSFAMAVAAWTHARMIPPTNPNLIEEELDITTSITLHRDLARDFDTRCKLFQLAPSHALHEILKFAVLAISLYQVNPKTYNQTSSYAEAAGGNWLRQHITPTEIGLDT